MCWQMLKPYVAGVIATVSIYFNLSSEMLSRTSSQICGRWYLPMFPGMATMMAGTPIHGDIAASANISIS